MDNMQIADYLTYLVEQSFLNKRIDDTDLQDIIDWIDEAWERARDK